MRNPVRKHLALTGAALFALFVSMLVAVAPPASAATGIRVAGGRIVESNGNAFVMRGTSHPHAWYATRTRAFADIKSLGANTVRVVLSGGRWTTNGVADVANIVSLCKQNRLICVLENHDTTGYGEQSGAYTLDQAVDYWISVRSAVAGQEDHVIINIGNEPIGNNAVTPDWTQRTIDAIGRMRAAGFEHALMVDAPNWGQDWRFTMRDNAARVFNSDPNRNVIFSIHMYGVFDTAAEITYYLQRFQTAGLPLVIGEFGHNHSDGDPDEDTIMAQAQARGIGYIGWSWSGNGGGVEYLDQVVDFDVNRLTSWGRRLFNGPNGIAATAREATIYGGGTPDTEKPTRPGTPTASDITSTGARLTWTASTDDRGVTEYDIFRSAASGGGRVANSATNSVTLTGLTPDTSYTFYVVALDAAGNTSDPSNPVTFRTASAPAGGCTASYRVANSWQGGFQAEVTVKNTGTSTINSWTVSWTFPNGQRVTQLWGGRHTQTGDAVTVRNETWNGVLAPNAATSFGFIGSWTGTNGVPAAVTCG
jgi:mannan endo-1,4-beta-mannosidase